MQTAPIAVTKWSEVPSGGLLAASAAAAVVKAYSVVLPLRLLHSVLLLVYIVATVNMQQSNKQILVLRDVDKPCNACADRER